MRISDWSSDVCSSDLELRWKPRLDRRVCCARAHRGSSRNQSWQGRAREIWPRPETRRQMDFLLGRQVGDLDVAWRRDPRRQDQERSEEHTSELQSLMRISYAVCGWKKKRTTKINQTRIS